MQDIIIGSDHRGWELKQQIKEHLRDRKHFFVDVGCESSAAGADFPVVAREVTNCVLSANHFCGILICGTGIGVSIAANRHKGIRAALCHTPEYARLAREHNDANVLCIGANGADFDNIKKVIDTFLRTKFLGDEKYRRRNSMLDK